MLFCFRGLHTCSRHAARCNNPAVYFLFYLLGDADGATARNGAASAIGGTVLGTFAYAQCIKAVPLAGSFEASSPPSPPAGRAGGADCGGVAIVAFCNFAFAGVSPGLVGAQMAPYAGAFFYVATITIEKCAYSCGFMNPAVVLATHVVRGARVHEKKRARTSRRTPPARGWARSPPPSSKRSPTGTRTARVRTARGGKAKASAARGGKSDPKKEKRREGNRRARLRAQAQAQGGVNVSARRSTFNNSLCQ